MLYIDLVEFQTEAKEPLILISYLIYGMYVFACKCVDVVTLYVCVWFGGSLTEEQ